MCIGDVEMQYRKTKLLDVDLFWMCDEKSEFISRGKYYWIYRQKKLHRNPFPKRVILKTTDGRLYV